MSKHADAPSPVGRRGVGVLVTRVGVLVTRPGRPGIAKTLSAPPSATPKWPAPGPSRGPPRCRPTPCGAAGQQQQEQHDGNGEDDPPPWLHRFLLCLSAGSTRRKHPHTSAQAAAFAADRTAGSRRSLAKRKNASWSVPT